MTICLARQRTGSSALCSASFRHQTKKSLSAPVALLTPAGGYGPLGFSRVGNSRNSYWGDPMSLQDGLPNRVLNSQIESLESIEALA